MSVRQHSFGENLYRLILCTVVNQAHSLCESCGYGLHRVSQVSVNSSHQLRESLMVHRGILYLFGAAASTEWRPLHEKCFTSIVLIGFCGRLKVLDRLFGALKLPNSCPTSHCVQTPVTQHQENDSPNVKKANVYGTSVNIDDSCAPGA